MNTTLLKTSLRHLLRHPWQVGLAILGVALGVAVVVAIDLANDSARRAFAVSSETLTGKATHQIIGGPAGFPDAVYRDVRVGQGVRNAAPVVEGYGVAPAYPGLTLHILGVDPLAEGPFRSYLSAQDASPRGELTPLLTTPGTALLSADTARQYGIGNGDTVQVRVGTSRFAARVLALIETQDEQTRRALDGLLVTDIATAQEWLGMIGQLSRVDLILEPAQVTPVQAALPAGVQLATPTARTQALQQMTAAFELNLTALSLLALVVGMFLIYNTITFSVVQRRGMLGTLRCLGVSRGQVGALVLLEAFVISLIGAALGVVLGVVLGRGLVGLVTQTINDLYFAVSVRDVSISAAPLIKGALLGVGATLLAAAVPALEATNTPPRLVQRRSSYEERVRRLAPVAAIAGGVLAAVALGMLVLPTRSLLVSFGALVCVVFGAALLTPALVLALMAAIRPVAGAALGLLGRMAVRDVTAALSRTSVAIAALMIAVSVTIGVGLMVGSFRETVARWLNSTLQADVYVSVPGQSSNRLDTVLPDAIIERLAATPGVDGIRRYRTVSVASPAGPTQIAAMDASTTRDRQAYQFVEGDAAAVWQGFDTGSVIVSEPLAYRRGLHVGDSISLQTARGTVAYPISGVFYDYASDQGVVMMPLERYRADWNDPQVTSLSLYAAPGQDVDVLVQRLRDTAGNDDALSIRSNRALREEALVVFDRTFAITRVLQVLAMIVAFVGILAALMALQLERARELGVLRANGLTPSQLWGLVVSQTGLMGLAAGLFAVPLGVVLALVLVFVINKRSFGWSLFFQLDWSLFGQAIVLAIVAAVLAGIYPAWRMSRTSPALALREE